MKQYNLTPLAEEWFTAQFDALVENKQDNARHVEFDVRAFTRFVIHYINDYHARHNWSRKYKKQPLSCIIRKGRYIESWENIKKMIF